MAYIVGILVGLLVCVFARGTGFDRDRAFYPTVLVVIALYYVLFAVMGGSMRALVLESVAMSVFAVVAVVGFKRNVWLVHDPGVPEWWPAFCMAADVGIAALLTSARQWLMVAARPR